MKRIAAFLSAAAVLAVSPVSGAFAADGVVNGYHNFTEVDNFLTTNPEDRLFSGSESSFILAADQPERIMFTLSEGSSMTYVSRSLSSLDFFDNCVISGFSGEFYPGGRPAPGCCITLSKGEFTRDKARRIAALLTWRGVVSELYLTDGMSKLSWYTPVSDCPLTYPSGSREEIQSALTDIGCEAQVMTGEEIVRSGMTPPFSGVFYDSVNDCFAGESAAALMKLEWVFVMADMPLAEQADAAAEILTRTGIAPMYSILPGAEPLTCKYLIDLMSAVPGDADSSGAASISDIVAILQYSANSVKYPLDSQALYNCDIDADGAVTAADAYEVQLMISGL